MTVQLTIGADGQFQWQATRGNAVAEGAGAVATGAAGQQLALPFLQTAPLQVSRSEQGLRLSGEGGLQLVLHPVR